VINLKDIIKKTIQEPPKAPLPIKIDMKSGQYLESMKSQAIKVIMLKKCKNDKHTRQRQIDIMKVQKATSIA
jgi:hypothetical protein